MLMVMFMMDLGKMIKLKVKVDMCIMTEHAIRVIGNKTNNTVRVMKLGLMVLHLKVITLKVKNMDRVSLFGQIRVNMMANFLKTIFMEKVFTLGAIIESFKVIGLTIRWRVMVFSLGLIIVNTKDNTLMIRSKEREHLLGQMEESISVNGITESKMVKVNTHHNQVKPKKVFGKKENVLIGFERIFTFTINKLYYFQK